MAGDHYESDRFRLLTNQAEEPDLLLGDGLADHADDECGHSNAKGYGSVCDLELTGGPNPYGTNSSLVAAALLAVQGGFTGAGWEILTPTGSAGQEFLMFVGVPEPAELVMLLIGLAIVALATRKNRVRQVEAA